MIPIKQSRVRRHILAWAIALGGMALLCGMCALAALPPVGAFVTAYYATPTPTVAPVITATLSSSAIISLASPIPHGAYAKLTIQTEPGAQCLLGYETPKGNGSTAQGLGYATANKQGVATWEWLIGARTRSGTGKLGVSCGDNWLLIDIVVQ